MVHFLKHVFRISPSRTSFVFSWLEHLHCVSLPLDAMAFDDFSFSTFPPPITCRVWRKAWKCKSASSYLNPRTWRKTRSVLPVQLDHTHTSWRATSWHKHPSSFVPLRSSQSGGFFWCGCSRRKMGNAPSPNLNGLPPPQSLPDLWNASSWQVSKEGEGERMGLRPLQCSTPVLPPTVQPSHEVSVLRLNGLLIS